MSRCLLPTIAALIFLPTASCLALERLPYNHPGLTVDLGVGLWAWPLPMDYDGDGDLDLVVSCPDYPSNGTYLFRNPGGSPFPVFETAVRIGPGLSSAQLSMVNGQPRVLTPGVEWTGFLNGQFLNNRNIYPKTNVHANRVRANQWRYVDFDGDGVHDLVIGIEDWTDYGWDDAFNAQGEWTRGPLRGFVYVLRNRGTEAAPDYADPIRVQADGKDLEVFGMPSPSFHDFDQDGDLDLICGEFLDRFTYFENVGTRKEPRYDSGRKLHQADGTPLAMALQMITPVGVDWDRDGDVDLICGDEDGRVAWIENTGKFQHHAPLFKAPRYFQQVADDVKFGALVNPEAIDWDGDKDIDLVCGNTAGELGFIENLAGGIEPKFAAPVLLKAAGKTIRVAAGPNGSIQGPAEAKWGYTSLSVADWDHDGHLDIMTNSIWGRIEWYRNLGGSPPELAAAQPVTVEWTGPAPKPEWNWWDPRNNELVTQWRTRPVMHDLDQDGLMDLVMLDHEGYLSFFRREKTEKGLILRPGQRIFTDRQGAPLRFNPNRAGKSGRRQWCFADWDRDGRLDILIDGKNIDFWKNVSTKEQPWAFENQGALSDHRLAGHTTCPTVVDWTGKGHRELLIGAEDGLIYRLKDEWTEPTRQETADFVISTRGTDWQKLTDGQTAYSNRQYVWADVPPAFQGWTYSRTAGGVTAMIAVTAKRDATVHLAVAGNPRAKELAGWKQVPEAVFWYTDQGGTRMHVFERKLSQGERVELPQYNWSGSLLLVPEPPQ